MRTHTTTYKVATPFGGAFLHTEVDAKGLVCGGAISHKWKEPDAQVSQLIEALSDGLNDTLAASGGRIIWWRRLLRQWGGR